MPPDLEPASALAERILDLEYPTDHAELVEFIESDRAAVREAALREAIEVVERWTWGTVNEMDTGKRRTLEALRKLLTEKRAHG